MIIAFTLAAAGIISGWLTSTVRTSTETVGGGMETQMECAKAALDIADALCVDNNVTVVVTNIGSISVYTPSIYARASDDTTCVYDTAAGTGTIQGGSSAIYSFNCTQLSGSDWKSKTLDFVRVTSNCQNKTAIYAEQTNINDKC